MMTRNVFYVSWEMGSWEAEACSDTVTVSNPVVCIVENTFL
jgi:hypothetical protein